MRAFLRLMALLTAVAILAYGLVASSGEIISGSGNLTYGSDYIWLLALYASALPIGYLLFSMIPRQTIGWRRNAWKVSAVLVAGFIILSLQLLREEFIIAPALASRPVLSGEGPITNPRLVDTEVRVQRGRVFDRDGQEIAGRSVTPDGRVQRTYPEPSAGYLVGYFSAIQYGRYGLEDSYDEYLSGRAGNPIQAARHRVLRQPLVGNDLYLTLDVNLQRLGQSLLGARKGAVVAMNPKTGAVLAMVTNPTYDPAQLAYNPRRPLAEEQRRIQRYWNELNGDPDAARLVNRAIQGLYSPGSTFKTITAAAALDSGISSPAKVYEDDGVLSVGGFVIRDPNRPDKNKTRWTFTEGYKYSLNAVFAQVGLDLESAGLREYGRRFGYERTLPFDLPVRQSQLEGEEGFLSDPTALAVTAFGQGQLLTTPLQVVLSTATIANGGVMARPYLVSEVKTPGGSAILRHGPEALQRIVAPQTAREMTALMVESVESGSGTNARIAGIAVAGKTGTAQLGEGEPHAWFTSFAPADDPKIAVVVLVENGGEGYRVAAPIACQMMVAALGDGRCGS